MSGGGVRQLAEGIKKGQLPPGRKTCSVGQAGERFDYPASFEEAS